MSSIFKIGDTTSDFFVCLNACFKSDHQTCGHSIQGQTCQGCINHYIVVHLCFKLLIKLSYYIHLEFWLKGFSSNEDQTAVIPILSESSTPRPER